MQVWPCYWLLQCIADPYIMHLTCGIWGLKTIMYMDRGLSAYNSLMGDADRLWKIYAELRDGYGGP